MYVVLAENTDVHLSVNLLQLFLYSTELIYPDFYLSLQDIFLCTGAHGWAAGEVFSIQKVSASAVVITRNFDLT